MRAIAPILPARDLPATLAFYERLGFEGQGLWPDEYLIVMRGEVGLHRPPRSTRSTCGWACPMRGSRACTAPRRQPTTA